MTEKDIMFKVLYNPVTKEIYTLQKGNVYVIENDTIEDKFKYLLNDGYIIKNVTEYGIDDSLSYVENFCHCDKCGNLFLQDDLSYDDGNECHRCKELSLCSREFNDVYEAISNAEQLLINFRLNHTSFNNNIDAFILHSIADIHNDLISCKDKAHNMAEYFTWE